LRWSFVCVAAGSGSRLGGEPKQFRLLGGRPVWAWSAKVARQLWREGLVGDFVLVVPHSHPLEAILEEWEGPLAPMGFSVVAGGLRRQDSVIRGIAQARGEMVLVHDAARPLVSLDLCLRLIRRAEERGSAVPLIGCHDSVRAMSDGEVVGSLDRSGLMLTQTPQAFPRLQLMEVLSQGGKFTDEAEAWLASGRRIGWVEGDRRAFKVTDQLDWEVARALVEPVEYRCGHGYDVHPLVPGRPLILGGLEIEGANLGLQGHSDADAVCHAVADAILGAAGEPDIGTLFPASDDRYKGAYSLDLLAEAYRRVVQGGFQIQWVDVTINAQVPKLSSWIPRIRSSISRALGGLKVVNVKVKSGEHVGSVGRGESIVCHAVATLRRS